MIVYKWVIKKKDKYYPIINNGAYSPFDNLNLGYYERGKTVEGFINPYQFIKNGDKYRQRGFHRTGFHFWTTPKGERFENYQKYMKRYNKNINCVLKCYVRQKDIIVKNHNRIIAKRFRVLNEGNLTYVKNTKVI